MIGMIHAEENVIFGQLLHQAQDRAQCREEISIQRYRRKKLNQKNLFLTTYYLSNLG